MLGGEETHQCWVGRRPTSAGWGDPPVLDGEETRQCRMGRRPTSAEWGGDSPPVCISRFNFFYTRVHTCTCTCKLIIDSLASHSQITRTLILNDVCCFFHSHPPLLRPKLYLRCKQLRMRSRTSGRRNSFARTEQCA